MSICAKCGAENAENAKFCQMCANHLGDTIEVPAGGKQEARSASPSLSTTVVMSIDPSHSQICPVCEAKNEGEWAFCQQCGSKLKPSPGDDAIDSELEILRQEALATTIRSQEALDVTPTSSNASGIVCSNCSQPLVSGAAFCHTCGTNTSMSRTSQLSSVRPTPKTRLVLIVDGQPTNDTWEVRDNTVIGRIEGDITFPHDDYLSGRHATITKRGDRFILTDTESRNGSYIRIKKEVEINSGDYILLGKQLLRFDA